MITPQTRAALAPLFARIARTYEADRGGHWRELLKTNVEAYARLILEPGYLERLKGSPEEREKKPLAARQVRWLSLVK